MDEAGGALHISLLGPLQATVGGEPVALGGPKPRAVLAVLALRPGTVVGVTELAGAVWGEERGDGVVASLQVHVSNLRKALGAPTIVTRSPGYLLGIPAEAVAHVAAEADIRAARGAQTGSRLDQAADHVHRALERWRGPALSDLLDAPFASTTATWLEDRRLVAVELLAEVDLERGEHRALVGRLEQEVAVAPYRETLWAHLMVALYRSGRQADALGAFQRARRELAEGLGVDPGPVLREVEAAILDHDPRLDAAPRPAPARPRRISDTTTVPAWAGGAGRLVRPGHDDVLVDGVIAIGRAETATVQIDEGGVSRRHAEIRPTVAGDLLVDLGSTNGTLVNGRPVATHVLHDGDEVQVGTRALRYVTG